MLIKRGTPEETKQLEKLFPVSTAEEALELSDLHKVIVGLYHLDLEAALNKPLFGSQMNSQDFQGYTPPHWAVESGNVVAVQTLLRHGAEVNSVSRYRRTPLHLSARYESSTRATRDMQYNMVQSLISAGADIKAKDKAGDQALHLACISSADVKLVKLLIANGAQLNEQSGYGLTPLNCAAIITYRRNDDASKENKVNVGSYLIEKGSVVDNRDNDGDTPLLQALFDRFSSFARMLLSRGADYTIVDNSGYTILHMAANFGDANCVGLLQQAKLRGVNPDAKDRKGKTATRLLKERFAPPEGLTAAFETLAESIRKANADPPVEKVQGGGEETEEEIEEEFVEAPETQGVDLPHTHVSRPRRLGANL